MTLGCKDKGWKDFVAKTQISFVCLSRNPQDAFEKLLECL